MSDFRSKCIAAVASLAVTAAILVSLDHLAVASGVPTWIKAAEAHSAPTASVVTVKKAAPA
jgi:hypothetical protein